jgi:exosortase
VTVATANGGNFWRQWVVHNWLLIAGIAAIAFPTMLYVARESWSTEQGAHGPIVFATGLWMLHRQWKNIGEVRKAPPVWKVACLLIPLLGLYTFARVAQIIEIEGFAMYGVLLVVLYAMIGFSAMTVIWFPLFYLAFTFPLPETVVSFITQPLKIWISEWSVDLLYFLGYPIASAGVVIQIGQYQVLVAAACAGLNSLVTLSAISLFYVYMRHQANWRYMLILLLAVVPVAIFANFVRVLILILLTYHGGEAMAQGFLHNFAGMTMFATALFTIFAIDLGAEKLWRRFYLRRSEVG